MLRYLAKMTRITNRLRIKACESLLKENRRARAFSSAESIENILGIICQLTVVKSISHNSIEFGFN